MSSANTTHIKCSNSEVIKVCSSILKSEDINKCENWNDGDTELTVITINSIPFRRIRNVSTFFPDDVINFLYYYEPDECKIFIVDFRCGEVVREDMEVGYCYKPISMKNEKDVRGIYDKATAFFHRLDKIETDKDGSKFINWFPEEVVYKFKYDGSDDKKLRVEATKRTGDIYFNVSEDLSNRVSAGD